MLQLGAVKIPNKNKLNIISFIFSATVIFKQLYTDENLASVI